MTSDTSRALDVLSALPSVPLWEWPSPLHELSGLRHLLGGGPRLLIKRDDLIGFGFGGNKVRKLTLVAARALEERADTLITSGGLQSNHARTTAMVAARLGLACHLVLNGEPPAIGTGNVRLSLIAGARIHYVPNRSDRAPAVGALAQRLVSEGRRPFVIPVGASTALGALGFARAFKELLDQMGAAPNVIVHATSSGGTQAGLLTGCAVTGAPTRVIGISADDHADLITSHIAALIEEMTGVLQLAGPTRVPADAIRVDEGFVGDGYGLETEGSREAIRLLAACDGTFLDPTYTSKAMAGLIAYVRAGIWTESQTVVFWHTGGLPGLFA